MADNITYEIKKKLGVISQGNNGWMRELNIVRWNNGDTDKYDIRSWTGDHERLTRGITLKEDEMETLVELYMKHKEKGDSSRPVQIHSEEKQGEASGAQA